MIINIFGEIWSGGEISSKTLAEVLQTKTDEPLTLVINSPGGDVFEGLAMFGLLKKHKGEITAELYGLCASAASIVAMAAKTRKIHESAMMLIHNASRSSEGNAADFEKAAEELAKVDSQLVAIYSQVTGKPAEEIEALMKENRLISSSEAIELKLVTEVIKSDASNRYRQTLKNQTDMNKITNQTPEELLAMITELQAQIAELQQKNDELQQKVDELTAKIEESATQEAEALIEEGAIRAELKAYAVNQLITNRKEFEKLIQANRKTPLSAMVRKPAISADELKAEWKAGKISTQEYLKIKNLIK